MVVVMQREATEADIEAVAERVRAAGGEAFGGPSTIIGLVGDRDGSRRSTGGSFAASTT
jgi:hypothetical protein